MSRGNPTLFGIVGYGKVTVENSPFSRAHARTLVMAGKAGIAAAIHGAFATRNHPQPKIRKIEASDFLGAQLLIDAAHAAQVDIGSITTEEPIPEEHALDISRGIAASLASFRAQLAREYEPIVPDASPDTITPHIGNVFVRDPQLGFIAPHVAKQLLIPYYGISTS